MIYHMQCVKRGNKGSLLVADLPFMSYSSETQTLENAAALMRAGANMVKLEGGAPMVETVRHLAEHGIPVCAHLGLLPQSVNKIGGYKVQGRNEKEARAMLTDARAMEDAGADILLLECVPSLLAAEITAAVEVPVIGIGAGPQCDAQVLVLYDMLGITPGKRPRFSKDFLQDSGDIRGAVRAFVKAVKDGSFPAEEHYF